MPKLRVSPRDEYLEKMVKIREGLPKDWRERVKEKHPEYDSSEGYNLLSRVYSLQTADAKLTPILAEIAKEHKRELRKAKKENQKKSNVS